MIKYRFKIDPDSLSDEEYYMLAAGASWLEERQAQIFARGIGLAFGGEE